MKNKFYISILFLFLFSLEVQSTPKTDSLKSVFESANEPFEKFIIGSEVIKALITAGEEGVELYYTKCTELAGPLNSADVNAQLELLKALNYYAEGDNLNAVKSFKTAIPLLEKNSSSEEVADAYSWYALNLLAMSDYVGAIENYEKSNKLGAGSDSEVLIGKNNINLGRCYENIGRNTEALACFQKALKAAQNLKNAKLEMRAWLSIGALYSEGINRKLGLDYLSKAAVAAEKLKDTSFLINSYTAIANSYYYEKNYQAALRMYEKIKILCGSGKDRNSYAGVLGNMGNVYSEMGELEKAMELQLEAVSIFNEIGDKQGLTICYSTIGIDYLNAKNYEKALEYLSRSLAMAQEMHSIEDLIEIHQSLSRLYEETKDFENAYANFKLYKQFNDSIFNTSNTQKLTELELNYQFEGKQKEAKLLQELSDERLKRTVYVSISGGLILLIVVFLVSRANQQRKRTNEQLLISKNAVQLQKEELENHKKEITDSINYAKRIQESILPPDTYWNDCLQDSFIFYRPKDIVSGDFYWIEHKGDAVCFAAVDCTGHGVPGALMSVVGFNLLTQAVNEMGLVVPSEILKHLDYGVTKTLRQSEDGKGVKDGMDLSLCSLNLKTNELQYAGAYNSLYYVTDGVLHEVKSDKFPIGVNIDGKVDNYTNHTFQLKKGDCVYLFSDGYADQFGGPKGKKYKYNQLKELLQKNYLLPVEEQKEALAKSFDSWKGQLEQVDDVVIIGVRI